MRLLTLPIQEPLPGRVLPQMAADHGPDEAARRYRAIVLTTLHQLRGLADTRLILLPDPPDAAEAVRFWLLPRLADRWESAPDSFRSDGWEISFGNSGESHEIAAEANILCPFISARWVHTALLGIERGTHQITGPAPDGGQYLHARPVGGDDLEVRLLPELPVIETSAHWDEALNSPLGPAIKRAWELEK